MDSERLSVYRAWRAIKRNDNTLYNALRSIYEDSLFIREIAGLWRELPLLANLRCGLWYSPKFRSTCYFKSTDGHAHNWSFSNSRTNLHVASIAGQEGGCIIVDSTRKGKHFPDSMSKTIPIWACVLNRAISRCRQRFAVDCVGENGESCSFAKTEVHTQNSFDWDCSLHVPLWVSETEKAAIEDCIDGWTEKFEASGADVESLTLLLKKPLRPLWISQRTIIWLNEVPDSQSWVFTPIILVSASSSNRFVQHRDNSNFSWMYIPGAGDDEESWARGLSSHLFWNHSAEIINSGPVLCNKKVADIIEKDRVYRVRHRLGDTMPYGGTCNPSLGVVSLQLNTVNRQADNLTSENKTVSWLGSTKLAVASSQAAFKMHDFDCILNCDKDALPIDVETSDYLHLPIMNSKSDRFSLLRKLSTAVSFGKLKMGGGKSLLVCCHNGEDVSICVSLAIFSSLFDDEGVFDGGESYRATRVTKWAMQKRLVFICKYAIDARPSRGNLKQVFRFLSDSDPS